jgi:hypothetical protein
LATLTTAARRSTCASERGVRIAAMRIAVSRAPDAEREVSPLELFFDLV